MTPLNASGAEYRRRQVSTSCTRKIINQLHYRKTVGAITLNEAYSSQTCPVCGERSKHRRIFRCPSCGASGPRDAVGAVNILSLGVHGVILPGRSPAAAGEVSAPLASFTESAAQ